MKILIAANQLSKGFAGKTLFSDISFGIEEKARVALIGPNGAGKSTLLKILIGDAEPDGGEVTRKRGLRVGFLEQTPHFQPGQTLLDAILEKAEDPHEAMDKAAALSAQLDLNRFAEDFPADQLSRGWQKRVALARELLREPELLLLDEPTNHLDIGGILWLERFLKSAPFACLMVTHDRLFLQRVVDQVLDLDPRNPGFLLNVRGHYSQYLLTKEQELCALKRHEKVLSNTLRREREWLSRGSLARQTKQSARIQGAAELADTVEALREKNQARRVDLDFGGPAHAPRRLIETEKLSKAFDKHVLFSDLDLLITAKTRLALLGDNGSGKSTLVKILLGTEAASSGQVRRAEGLQVAHFEQGRETLDLKSSVLKNICPEGDYVDFRGQFVHVRSYLDRFYFSGSKADLPAAKLSGGEQARLRLAQLMLKPCQLLVLDEPTNDLDSETMEVLQESLADFSGAVVLVTHDRFFMDAVADEIVAFPPPAFSSLGLQKFASYFQWEEWFESLSRKDKAIKPSQATAPQDDSTNKATPPAKAKLSYKEKFELEGMEGAILKLEEEIAALSAESQAPATLTDHKKLSLVLADLAQKQSELDAKYERWSALSSRA